MRQLRSMRGFTLVELLIVVIILGILAALVLPRFAGRTEEARIQAARTDIEAGLATALDLYEADNGTYPRELDDLVNQPASAARWKGPYVKKRAFRDPWGHEYVYRFPGINNPRAYDLSSAGTDGEEGTEDDITNWEEEAFEESGLDAR